MHFNHINQNRLRLKRLFPNRTWRDSLVTWRAAVGVNLCVSLCPLFNPHRQQKQGNLLSHVRSPTRPWFIYSLHFYFPSLHFSWVWQTNSFQLMKRCGTGVSPHPWRSWPAMPDKSLKYVSLGMDLSGTKCDVMRCNAARHGTTRHDTARHDTTQRNTAELNTTKTQWNKAQCKTQHSKSRLHIILTLTHDTT